MFPVHRKYLINLTDLEIVSTYNAQLRGICSYYGIAGNFNKLCYFAYLMEYSCPKTLASKHKCQMPLLMRQSSMDTPAIHLKAGKKKNAVNYAELQKATITKFTMSIRLKT